MRPKRSRVRAEVPARTALVGNPSDGFGGATIAVTLPELRASVTTSPARSVHIEAADARMSFADAAELVAAASTGAYPPAGPLALAMAAASRTCERAQAAGTALEGLGFHLDVADSTIPPRVGLAGSSAIVIGVIRSLGELLGAAPTRDELPALALACEADELGIAAGLQDRVVQAHGGLVFMDFDATDPSGGRYEPLDRAQLPPLCVFWLADAPTDSGTTHQTVRERHARGDREVRDTMDEIAALAHAGRTALIRRDHEALGALMARNFDLRRRIYSLDPRHTALVEVARALGVPANYTGSGGAIVTFATDAGRMAQLHDELERRGCRSLPVA